MIDVSRENIDMPGSEKLYSIRALTPPRAAHLLARWLTVVFILFLVIMFLPWQQKFVSAGEVSGQLTQLES